MKTLKFDPQFINGILNATKRTTWRIGDDKDLSVNDEIAIVNSQTSEVAAHAIIDSVVERRLGDIGLDEYPDHSYKSREAMYETFRKWYTLPINAQTPVKVIEFTVLEQKDDKNTTIIKPKITEAKLFTDGGSRGNPGPSASAYVIYDTAGRVIEKSGQYIGVTTNNQAEYQALRRGLERAQALGISKLRVFMDSLLVVNQMKGLFKVKNRDLWPIYQATTEYCRNFSQVEFNHVPRELNKYADGEVNRILDRQSRSS